MCGEKVMIDVDLAALHGAPTKRLNEQVKRNSERFPPDFIFRLTQLEKAEVVTICDYLLLRRCSPPELRYVR
jgi:ORF6N domain